MNTKIDYSNLDGWSLSKLAIDYILENLKEGSTILEFGSGDATKELVKRYKVYSVEQNIQWIGYVPESTYIYAPIVNGWYDIESVLPHQWPIYDFLLIDGPIGSDRLNFLSHLEKFNLNVPILIDDTNRGPDKELAGALSFILKRKSITIDGGYKSFTVILQ